MLLRHLLLIAGFFAVVQIAAYDDAAAQGRGNGNGFGIGNGGGNGNGNGFGLGGGNAGGNGRGNGGRGGGGGAPLPLMGVTLLGQAAGAAGIYTLWRRRKKART